MEIKYLEQQKKLIVEYKGYPVYVEIAGDLFAYSPFDDWESKIEKLYDLAVARRKTQVDSDKSRIAEVAMEKQKSVLQRLRFLWGI